MSTFSVSSHFSKVHDHQRTYKNIKYLLNRTMQMWFLYFIFTHDHRCLRGTSPDKQLNKFESPADFESNAACLDLCNVTVNAHTITTEIREHGHWVMISMPECLHHCLWSWNTAAKRTCVTFIPLQIVLTCRGYIWKNMNVHKTAIMHNRDRTVPLFELLCAQT